MKFKKSIFILFFALTLCLIPIKNSYSGQLMNSSVNFSDTDGARPNQLISFFDLRDRESFIQVTNVDSVDILTHIQIWNVDSNCNENDFFDGFTINDTHVYNMRDIQTNDGNPSGVVLPDNAYGIVVISTSVSPGGNLANNLIIGNFRIIDNLGYEYRTNSQAAAIFSTGGPFPPFTFNFNKESGVTLSDVVGITVSFTEDITELDASNFTKNQNRLFGIDIVNNDEVVFSCRNVIFACIDEDNPRQEELLEFIEDASIARFEYGINEAIPHSKGGEVLCPGNNISEGFVLLDNVVQNIDESPGVRFYGYIGLNNGNGRGSMDSWWIYNIEEFSGGIG